MTAPSPAGAARPGSPTRPGSGSPGLGARRRKLVMRYGKLALRNIDRWFARQSLVPNEPVLDPALFPWLAEIEGRWRSVRAELEPLLRDREALPRFQDISRDQYRISPDDKWRTFVLYGFGYRSEANCRLCPETARLLSRVPGLENAFFSILGPGKHVPSHRGITKGLIRCHLGLVVPGKADRCLMRVGGVVCTWEPGRVLVFDDSFAHEVHNDTDEERVVLLFDFARPLTRRARLARRALFALFRRTAYVRDARELQARWERRYYAGGAESAH